MDSDGILLEVERRKFHKLLQRKSVHNIRGKVNLLRKMTGNSYYDIAEAIELDLLDLEVIQQAGSGCFGEVYLVKDVTQIEDDNLLAVKAITKQQGEEEEDQIKIIVEREKNIL